MYKNFFNYLGNDKTVIQGYPNLLKYRLFTMYTRKSKDEMKEKIMLMFKTIQKKVIDHYAQWRNMFKK